jgi:uncharacterized protein (DUF2147 family)
MTADGRSSWNTTVAIRRLTPVLVVLLLLTGIGHAAPASSDDDLSSPVGLWAPTDSRGKPLGLIRIFEQDEAFFGRIEPSSPSDNFSARCTRCSGDRKDQPIIGLVIMRHLRLRNGEYVGGDILDPRTGRVYGCKFRLIDGGKKLIMRGYLGISLLGHSQTWVRVNEAQMTPY